MADTIFYAESQPEILPLEIRSHFNALTDHEKAYAHWMSRAAFEGTRIILRQNSAESEAIFDLLLELHRLWGSDWSAVPAASGLSEAEVTWFLEYASMVLDNLGNYASFNGKKFYPRLGQESFQALCKGSDTAESTFRQVSWAIYEGSEVARVQGYPDAGNGVHSNYYPDTPLLVKEAVSNLQDFLASEGILTENTRLRRIEPGDGTTVYEVLVASEEVDAGQNPRIPVPNTPDDKVEPNPAYLVVQRGDHSREMRKINDCVRKARQYASSEAQARMLDAHLEGFRSGNMSFHKDAQKFWTEDKSPQVESLLGFIEYYGDPHGVRAEWRGFVLLQNKPETQMLAELLSKADQLLTLLPWNMDGHSPFEQEVFKSPDFTSMEALTFVSSSIPVGTNAPNFRDLRDQYGFKNLAIRNRLVELPAGQVSFLSPEDSKLYAKLAATSFGMLTVLHELFGHGSGKHLAETSPGHFNFDVGSPPVNPVNGKTIASWYKVGESFGSVFGWSYEECRCELVGLYLSFFPEVRSLFNLAARGISDEDALYIEFLYIARAGILGLASWRPETNTWGSTYGRARYVIMMQLVHAEIVQVTSTGHQVTVSIDRKKLLSHGQEAVEKLLLEMHVCICTADRAGLRLYELLSEVGDDLSQIQHLVAKEGAKQKQILQGRTILVDGAVELREYPASPAGMLQSWAECGI